LQQTNILIILYRLVRILTHILVGISIVASIWSFTGSNARRTLTKWWCNKLLRCFNIQLITHGKLPDSTLNNTMFIANHISWADIYALNSILPLQFIAKSDINQWPILGYLVRKSGTIFINRNSRKDTSRIVEITTEHLVNGANVGFFPEGTTSDGTELHRFKSSIVQAAINAGASIQPVAIRYPTPNGKVNTKMAYAGETTLGQSMMNVLKLKSPVVELQYLPTIQSGSFNRQAITQMAYNSIAKVLAIQ
jgi:1-acyl-sn-glycerol-3-phosphate acyltransferase